MGSANLTYHKKQSFASKYFIFGKICLNLRTSYKKLVWFTNQPLSNFFIKPLLNQTLLKIVSATGIFLWVLQNFQEHLFYRTFLVVPWLLLCLVTRVCLFIVGKLKHKVNKSCTFLFCKPSTIRVLISFFCRNENWN